MGLGLAPAAHAHITGLIRRLNLPHVSRSARTTSSGGARCVIILTYCKAIQEVVSRQLAEWGDGRDTEARPRMAPERDLERVLEDLADAFPLLRPLVDPAPEGRKTPADARPGDERTSATVRESTPIVNRRRETAWPRAAGRTAKQPEGRPP